MKTKKDTITKKSGITATSTKKMPALCDGEDWLYSDIVKDHFFHPRNILIDDADYVAHGLGVVGSPACGDMMAVWIKVNKKSGRITECKWRTFGCASAIASTSMMSVMATENGGMTLAQAKRLSPEAIIDRLDGLPNRKYHCSVLGHTALREAVMDYEKSIV
ncbi:MAG: iron-sulfur cluster assembly scaffold protein [bacterium]